MKEDAIRQFRFVLRMFSPNLEGKPEMEFVLREIEKLENKNQKTFSSGGKDTP